MLPSIGAAQKIAKLGGTTVGYLLGETDEENILKDPEMLKRLNKIEKMEDTDKGHILSVIDGFIKSIKIKNIMLYKARSPANRRAFLLSRYNQVSCFIINT